MGSLLQPEELGDWDIDPGLRLPQPSPTTQQFLQAKVGENRMKIGGGGHAQDHRGPVSLIGKDPLLLPVPGCYEAEVTRERQTAVFSSSCETQINCLPQGPALTVKIETQAIEAWVGWMRGYHNSCHSNPHLQLPARRGLYAPCISF